MRATSDADQPRTWSEDPSKGRADDFPAASKRGGSDAGHPAPDQPTPDQPAADQPALEPLVHAAVARLPAFRGTTLLAEPNRDKYRAEATGARAEELEQVFEVMRDLNAGALADPTLAADAEGRHGLRERLHDAVDDLVAVLADTPVTYVEFGPEPTKTHAILARLRDAGVPVRRYLAVDINPASGARMREALGDLLDPRCIEVLNQPFETVEPEALHTPGTTTVLTSLGFQEGNEHPDAVARTLGNLLRPGDIVLGEMQIADRGDEDAFEAFYNTDLMRRFSRLCVARAVPGVTTSFRLAITDVDCGLDAPVKVCAMCEDLPPDAEGGPRSFITNICLKPTSAQWRAMRTRRGQFEVLSQRRTGDLSVAFQVARRVSDGTDAPEGTRTDRGGG